MNTLPRLHEQTMPTLDALATFWPFKRKMLADTLRQYLRAAQEDMDRLGSLNQQLTTQCQSQHIQLQEAEAQIYQLDSQLAEETKTVADLSFQLAKKKSALDQAEMEISALGSAKADLLTKVAGLEAGLAEKRATIQELTIHLDDTTCSLENANSTIADLSEKKVLAIAKIGELESGLDQVKQELLARDEDISLLETLSQSLKESQGALQRDHDALKGQHLSLNDKYELVRVILAQEPINNVDLTNFAKLIDQDFMSFANRESSLANEAEAVLAMQAILGEIGMAVNFPSIVDKSILCVAGGFSSGKSAFINSFILDDAVRLAVGLTPVTVVPSYVVYGESTRIFGYAYNGGAVELDQKVYNSLSHEYAKSLGFDLRRILPHISVEVALDADLFEHLCIIDTPGYNPGSFGDAEFSDHDIALSHVRQADAMIWAIGLDPAGTISQSDIEFIESTPFRDESLYIVLTKADVKSDEDIEAILAQVQDDLAFADIEVAGICAYSSVQHREYPYSGQSLTEFLHSCNGPKNIVKKISEQLDDVFDKYVEAIQDDVTQLKLRRSQFEAFQLAALEVGGTELYDKVEEVFPAADKMFDFSEQSAMLNECKALRAKFKQAAERVLSGSVGIDDSPDDNEIKSGFGGSAEISKILTTLQHLAQS